MRYLTSALTVLVTSAAGIFGWWPGEHTATPPKTKALPPASAALELPNTPEQGLSAPELATTETPSTSADAAHFVGVLLPAQATDVTAPFSGTVDRVHIALGDEVSLGAPLVSLSVEQAHLELKRAEAERDAATAALSRAQVEFRHATDQSKRVGKLVAEGLANKEELAQARFQAQESRGRIAEAKSLLAEKVARAEQLAALEDDAQVSASFAGVVAVRYVDEGARVAAGTPLLRLISREDLVLRFAIPEHGLGSDLREGEIVAASAKSGTLERRFTATVIRLAPEIDSASRMRTVEATPQDAQSLLEAGLVGGIVSVTPQVQP